MSRFNNATFSIDRRNGDEQREDKSIFVGLTYDGEGRNRVAKLQFKGTTCQESVQLSDKVQEKLFRCHTMSSDMLVVFYRDYVILLDGHLSLIS